MSLMQNPYPFFTTEQSKKQNLKTFNMYEPVASLSGSKFAN